jgi:hypothetical protein
MDHTDPDIPGFGLMISFDVQAMRVVPGCVNGCLDYGFKRAGPETAAEFLSKKRSGQSAASPA